MPPGTAGEARIIAQDSGYNPTTMPLLIVVLGIALLLVLILGFKLNSFVAFVIVSLAVALGEGMALNAAVLSIEKGIGDTLGILVLILGLGAMLGKLVADSGAAQRITSSLIGRVRDGPGAVGADAHGLHHRRAAVLRRRLRHHDAHRLCRRGVDQGAAAVRGAADAGVAVGHARLPAAPSGAHGHRGHLRRGHREDADLRHHHRDSRDHPCRAGAFEGAEEGRCAADGRSSQARR